jgi:hypothetical protein
MLEGTVTRIPIFVSAILVVAPADAHDATVPRRLGTCVVTTITDITGVYGNPHPGPEGAIVNYANRVAGVSFARALEIEHSAIGDPVRLCLVAMDRDCPRGDPRGRIYRATNLRTKGSWKLGNSMHACDGA